jgi:ribosomal protein S18 acetylase RimI-like enzyme
MAPAFRVRRLLAADAGDYRALRLQGLRDCPEAFGAAWGDEASRPLDWFADRLERNPVLGGRDDRSALCGVGGLRFPDSAKSRHIAQLWGFYVAPEARRRGLAAALLEALIREAEGEFEAIRLAVVASNEAAVRLYARAGFVEFGREPSALKVDGRYHDELLMRLQLPSSRR